MDGLRGWLIVRVMRDGKWCLWCCGLGIGGGGRRKMGGLEVEGIG